MGKVLFMFTNDYPYGTGETFIENEILVSSKIYKKVYICVMNIQRENALMREIPQNVEVITLSKHGKFYKAFSTVAHIVMGIFLGDLFAEWKKCRTLGEFQKSIIFYNAVMERYAQLKKHEFILEENRIDFYCYWFLESVYVADLLKKVISPDSVLITRAHGYDLYTERTSFNYFPFRKQLLRKVNRVCPCSLAGEQYLKNKYPNFSNKIVCSYLGTKDSMPQPAEKEKDSFIIVTCSNIIPLKRVIRVAETLALIEQENSRLKIEWYCFGDGELRRDIEEYCKKNLRKIKAFFMGQTANEDILEFYKSQNVDLFINVSETEGLPVSIMEAASFGIPAIATEVGGSPEIVLDGVTGYLIDKDFTNDELKTCILRYANMPFNKKRTMKKNTREYWKKNFSADNNYPKFFQQYDELSE